MNEKELITRALKAYSIELDRKLEFFSQVRPYGLDLEITNGITKEYTECLRVLAEVDSGEIEVTG